MRSSGLLILLLVLAAGCGGDSTGPERAPYPEVEGIYDYTGTVNGIPGAALSGTFTLVDDSRETPGFSGTFSVDLIGPDGSESPFSGSIVNGTVDASGVLSLDFLAPEWHHTGTLDGQVASGTWILRGSQNFTGTFTAVRR